MIGSTVIASPDREELAYLLCLVVLEVDGFSSAFLFELLHPALCFSIGRCVPSLPFSMVRGIAVGARVGVTAIGVMPSPSVLECIEPGIVHFLELGNLLLKTPGTSTNYCAEAE